jgi:hypothetical protein
MLITSPVKPVKFRVAETVSLSTVNVLAPTPDSVQIYFVLPLELSTSVLVPRTDFDVIVAIVNSPENSSRYFE